MKTFKIVGDDISDGYHTFDELYEHRCLLYLHLCLINHTLCAWRPDYDGWFVLYFESPSGQISYHVPDKYLYLVKPLIRRDDAHVFDGHTSPTVLLRLESISQHYIRDRIRNDNFTG